jgi:ATP-binding cassette, subfamily B (MDR/TAP), member 1
MIATTNRDTSYSVQFTRLSELRTFSLPPSLPSPSPVGAIELRDVDFAYPSRPNVQVCKGYNLTIKPGETVAMCGASGAGKSTIMNLLLRFYDPLSGSVLIDDVDVRTLNVRWLRNCMGYVGQEPVLFAGTIAENIAYGVDKKVDGVQDAQTLRMRVENAAKTANAHDFISAFPQGYDTDVGANGGSMSGGQKQRIAIARALIKQPSVLLLDEATSALDAASERIVQQSIDKLQASKAQTTIIIAHRLSTIRNADRIAVVSDGKISEIGTHDELLALKGLYADMVSLQMEGADDDTQPKESVYGQNLEESKKDEIPKSIPLTGLRKREKEVDISVPKKAAEIVPIAPSKVESKKLRTRIWGLVWPHVWWLIFGLLGSAMVGGTFPIWGLLIASALDIFYYTDAQSMRDASAIVAYRFILLGINSFIGHILQFYCLAQVGQRISATLRSDTFESLMRREIAFFDDEDNAVGTLTTQLADDARAVHQATGESLSGQFQAFFNLAVGLIIGFTASWKITLVLLATLPISAACGALQMAESTGQHHDLTEEKKHVELQQKKVMVPLKDKKGLSDGNAETDLSHLEPVAPAPAVQGGEGGLISAAFTNMRTVSAFSIQYEVAELYGKMTGVDSARRQSKVYYSGFIYSLSKGCTYFVYALLFWYGATLIVDGSINFLQLLTAIMALMLAAMGVGHAINNLSDQKAGLLAAQRIFKACDDSRESPIDGLSVSGLKPSSRPKAKIELKNIFFSYPTRPEVEVCTDYSLVIEPGQVVALVGPSGSGKSTIMNLLLRFYDPLKGQIFLDGKDTRELNVKWLRAQIG